MYFIYVNFTNFDPKIRVIFVLFLKFGKKGRTASHRKLHKILIIEDQKTFLPIKKICCQTNSIDSSRQ